VGKNLIDIGHEAQPIDLEPRMPTVIEIVFHPCSGNVLAARAIGVVVGEASVDDCHA
jgi:hypothetical protein